LKWKRKTNKKHSSHPCIVFMYPHIITTGSISHIFEK
jgi:hypothetical protein